MTEMIEFRNLLREVIQRDLPSEPVALLFSGGTDSLTVLWILLELGIDVTCYTFNLSYFQSTDLRASKKACEHWKVKQIIVNEDHDENIPQQLRKVIGVIKSARKTHVEVMYGYWYLINSVKEKHIYSGIQADTLYGSNKKSAIHYGKKTAEEFTTYRKELVSNPGQEGLLQARLIAEQFGKILHAPYSDNSIREFFYQYSWKQLNSPRQKMPPVVSFFKEFGELPIYRHDDNMQCGSHLREHLAIYVTHYRKIYQEIFGEPYNG